MVYFLPLVCQRQGLRSLLIDKLSGLGLKQSLILLLIFTMSTAFADEKENLTLFFKVRENLSAQVESIGTDNALTFNSLNELTLLSQALLRFYQLFISSQDVPRCPFEPTCSEYARQAIANYGFTCGLLMALDRFQRCNGLGAWYYPHLKNSRLFDPPAWNLP